ncbi:MAG: hypothetical protein Q4F74_03855 [Synergistaceae bacterium]|nr:hypothetical protein [Synergistaceae bacterium]
MYDLQKDLIGPPSDEEVRQRIRESLPNLRPQFPPEMTDEGIVEYMLSVDKEIK